MAHKYQVAKWKARRHASKLQIIGTLTILFATVFVILYHLGDNETWTRNTWIKLGLLLTGAILYLFSSFVTFSNYSFLFKFYECKWLEMDVPEVLEITTGKIERIESLYIPYAGHFKRITFLPLKGKPKIYYMETEKFRSIDSTTPTRLLVYHMFAVRSLQKHVESAAG